MSPESGNKTHIADNYSKTISILIDHGADPEVENRIGFNVSDLLQEFNIPSLTIMLATRLAGRLHNAPAPTDNDTLMLLKDNDGALRHLTKDEERKRGKGQGDARKSKKVAVPTNSLVFDGKPRASSFETKKATVALRNVRFGQEAALSRGVRVEVGSQQRLNPNCIIIKKEKVPDGAPVSRKTGVVNHGSEVFAAGVANCHSRQLQARAPRSRNPSPKRLMSPDNASVPEMAKTDKCAKRKTRVCPADKDRGDIKKLKCPDE